MNDGGGIVAWIWWMCDAEFMHVTQHPTDSLELKDCIT